MGVIKSGTCQSEIIQSQELERIKSQNPDALRWLISRFFQCRQRLTYHFALNVVKKGAKTEFHF